MPNLNAALGCAQIEQLPTLLTRKRELFARYSAAFAGVKGARLMSEPADCQSNYWLQTILLDEELGDEREAVLKATNAAGLATRPTWTLMSDLLPFAQSPKMDLSCAQSLARRIINIPSSPNLGEAHQ